MLRMRVTPTLDADGAIRAVLETVEVENEQVLRVLSREEWRTLPARAGSAYVSRVGFEQATELPGTFWLDEEGRRHFVVPAEAGRMGLTGENMG